MKIETFKNFYEIVEKNDKFDPKKIEYKFIRLIEGVSKLSDVFLTESNFKNKEYKKEDFIIRLMEMEYLTLSLYKTLNDRHKIEFNFNILIETIGNKIRYLREEYNSNQKKITINFIYMRIIKTIGDLSNTFINRDNKGDDKIRFDCITNILTFISFLLDLSFYLYKDKYENINEFEKYYLEIFKNYSIEYEKEIRFCYFNIEKMKNNLNLSEIESDN